MCNISNQFISENLIQDYVKTPPSLKEQTLTKLSIQLCAYSDLKEHIIWDQERIKQNLSSLTLWDEALEDNSSIICQSLVPYALRTTLKCRIRSIAIRLLEWNKEHQIRLTMTPQDVHQILTPSDWTVEGRINERKVAERIVQNEDVSVCKRYQLACLHFLETFIYPLWNRILPACQKAFLRDCYPYGVIQSKLVIMWSHHLTQIKRTTVSRPLTSSLSRRFWEDGLEKAIKEGQISAFTYCWNMLSERKKQKVLIRSSLKALSRYNKVRNLNSPTKLVRSNKWIPRSARYIDILYFLFSRMSEEQRVEFFEISFIKYSYPSNYDSAFLWVLEHPYQSYCMLIISKLWGILPEEHYESMVDTIAIRFGESWTTEYEQNKTEYLDYNYGGLLLELLDKAPGNYKSYVFREKPHSVIKDLRLGKKLLDMAFKKQPFGYINIGKIWNILKHTPVKERQLIMHSRWAENFIKYFIVNRKLNILDAIVLDCLPDKGIIVFRKNFLLTKEGKNVCFRLISKGNVDFLNSLLNWGHFSEEEISDYKLKLIDLNSFSCELRCLLLSIKFDYFHRVLEWCLPSDCSRKEFKEMFVKIQSIGISSELVKRSKWKDFLEFISWAYPSKKAQYYFKREFFTGGHCLSLVSHLITRNQSFISDVFLNWCSLSLEEIKQVKKNTLFCTDTIKFLIDGDEETIKYYLRWGLSNKKSVMDFKSNVKLELEKEIMDEEEKDIKRKKWDRLIKDRISELASELRERREAEILEEGGNPSKKFKMQNI